MRRKELFSNFAGSPFFTKQALKIAVGKFDIGSNTLNTNIQRGVKKKEIYKLKNGLYVHREFYRANQDNIGYIFYLSNILLPNSYVSRESALQYYGLLSEGAYRVITAVTTKIPRKFSNKLGIFDYRNIKQELYKAYALTKKRGFEFFIAEPHKAIFDYLYYRSPLSDLKSKGLEDVLEEFRIDYENLPEEEFNKLDYMINPKYHG